MLWELVFPYNDIISLFKFYPFLSEFSSSVQQRSQKKDTFLVAFKSHTVPLAYCIRPNILNCDLKSEIMALLMRLTVYKFVEQSNT